MASSTVYHARSISLPSRPHPVVEQLDEQLTRLRSSQVASTSSSSISHGLNGLNDLYSCVDELLQLPLNQQDLSMDEVLDGSVRLLDICSASRDSLQMSREHLQDVQSALRKRCSGELTITSEAAEYLNTRKTIKKTIKKCLKSLRPTNEHNNEAHPLAKTLKDVHQVTDDTFKSLLSYIAGSQKSGSSIFSKLINKNTTKETASTSAFEEVDATLNSIISHKKNGVNMSQMENLRNQIFNLESEIQDLDEALEGLFRHLVKTRATLLNIISY